VRQCHPSQARQFWQSRHSIPAYAAMVGTEALSPEAKAAYDQIAEANRTAAPQPGDPAIGFSPRNALFALEGPVTEAACERCHNIGKEAPDGSRVRVLPAIAATSSAWSRCASPRHATAAHIGRDHPHWEILPRVQARHPIPDAGRYLELDGRARPDDSPGLPGATCQLCHMGDFGSQPTTHDTGDRLSYFLLAAMFQAAAERGREPGAHERRVPDLPLAHLRRRRVPAGGHGA